MAGTDGGDLTSVILEMPGKGEYIFTGFPMNHIISHYCLYVGEYVTYCSGIVKIKEVTWS